MTHSDMRELTMNELDAVSGGEVVGQGTVIKISMDKGTIVIGYISTGGGPTLPYAKWTPK
jgi:bacteriocin-like protein